MNWETIAAVTLVLIGSAGIGGSATVLLQFTLLAKLRRKIEALTVAKKALPSNDAEASIRETRDRLDQRIVELTDQLINETSRPRRAGKAPSPQRSQALIYITGFMVGLTAVVTLGSLLLSR